MDHDDFIVVGSSHTYRLANAMKEAGETVNCLASPFWRPTVENITNTSAALTEAVTNNPHATVVLQLYDSSIYFASAETGELTLPKRGEDGKYHIVGELVLADWSAFKKIFNVSALLLRAAGTSRKIILSPLPRFVMASCCDDERHLTNQGTKGYAKEMGRTLADIHTWVDDLAHGKRIKKYEVLCPSSAIGLDSQVEKKQLAKLWGGGTPSTWPPPDTPS